MRSFSIQVNQPDTFNMQVNQPDTFNMQVNQEHLVCKLTKLHLVINQVTFNVQVKCNLVICVLIVTC